MSVSTSVAEKANALDSSPKLVISKYGSIKLIKALCRYTKWAKWAGNNILLHIFHHCNVAQLKSLPPATCTSPHWADDQGVFL